MSYDEMTSRLLEDGEEIFFLEDQMLFAVDFDFGAGIFAEDDRVARFDLRLAARAVVQDFAGADRDDFRFHRTLFGVVRDDDAARGLFLGGEALDQDAVL